MNSLLKQTTSISESSPENFLQTFEDNLLKIQDSSEAEILYKKLSYLGLNFDPFNPEVPNECREIMENMGLTLHLQNPYQATNILLRLLDKTEERLNNLKQ